MRKSQAAKRAKPALQMTVLLDRGFNIYRYTDIQGIEILRSPIKLEKIKAYSSRC